MHVIEKLRDIWMRYGGGFNSLSPYELDEFIHSAWILVLLGGVLACIVALLVVLEPRIAHQLEHVQRIILNTLTSKSF